MLNDIIIETSRMVIVGAILLFLHLHRNLEGLNRIRGWNYIMVGFGLIFFGMVVDLTDNFPSLNRFVIIGDTEYQALLEKVVGYLGGFAALAIGIWQWIPAMIELEQKRAEELEAATREIKILSGFLPICANCKKIRDDKGYWNQIETYIHAHSEARFSHGICPECRKKLYPGIGCDKVDDGA